MKIAYCLYGFIAEQPREDDIIALKSVFPSDSQIDIFYSCPTILHEQMETEVDTRLIETIFKNSMSGSVNFEWRVYDPFIFIKEVIDKKLPKKSDITNSYYNRVLSQFYSISSTLKLLEKTVASNSNLKYDAIVVTRYSYIKSIKSIPAFNEPFLKKGVYLWRGNGYCVPHRLEDYVFPYGNAEDRLFYGTYESLICIKDIYSFAVNTINPINAFGEGILDDYLRTQFNSSELHLQEGIHPIKLQTLSGYGDYKRSNDCETTVNKYYDQFTKLL